MSEDHRASLLRGTPAWFDDANLGDMNTTRVAIITAAAAVVSWALKSVAIGTAGGVNESPLEGPLFFLGILCFVVGVCSLALSIARHRNRWVKSASVAGAILAVGVGVTLSGIAVERFAPTDHWVWEEMSLWLPALALLAVSVWHASRQSVRVA